MRTHRPAHVVVYELLVGRVPPGWHLHHKCEQKGCVNPKHLTPLTPSEHARLHWDQTLGDALCEASPAP